MTTNVLACFHFLFFISFSDRRTGPLAPYHLPLLLKKAVDLNIPINGSPIPERSWLRHDELPCHQYHPKFKEHNVVQLLLLLLPTTRRPMKMLIHNHKDYSINHHQYQHPTRRNDVALLLRFYRPLLVARLSMIKWKRHRPKRMISTTTERIDRRLVAAPSILLQRLLHPTVALLTARVAKVGDHSSSACWHCATLWRRIPLDSVPTTTTP